MLARLIEELLNPEAAVWLLFLAVVFAVLWIVGKSYDRVTVYVEQLRQLRAKNRDDAAFRRAHRAPKQLSRW